MKNATQAFSVGSTQVISMMRTKVFAKSHSAISVVNALASGKGAAIGIAIECKVTASFVKGTRLLINSQIKDHHNLIATSVDYALNALKQKLPKGENLEILVDSDIPTAVGLKSSSAVSVAVVEAIFKLFNDKAVPLKVLNTSCSASKDSGASLTGAYDDASACLLGGFVLTDNSKFKIVQHSRVPAQLGEIVVLLVPKKEKRFTSGVKTSAYSQFRNESLKAFEYARKHQVAEAMLLNSIIQCSALKYSFAPISNALSSGATAAGITGKGPAVAALCSNRRIANQIIKTWTKENRDCTVIITKIVQPKPSIV